MPPAVRPRPRGLFVGLATLDVVHRVTRAPSADEKVVATGTDVAAGGPAAGAAVTFAGLGGSAVLVTVLGAHPLAVAAREDLRAYGVEVVDTLPDLAGPPPVSSAVVVEETGERSVVSRNAEGIAAVPPPGLRDLVAEADVVLVDGHHPALCAGAVALAREARAPVVLDGGSWKPVLAEVLPGVTLAACSERFAVPAADGAAGRPAASALLELGVPAVAVTAGPRSVQWCTGVAQGEVAVPRVEARDTLAAGDAFHGALAYAVSTDAPWPLLEPPDPARLGAALRAAVAVAALRVQHRGPRAWLDRLAEEG